MAFCSNCGTKVEDSMKFCPSCGAPLGKVPQTSTKASPAPKPLSRAGSAGDAATTAAAVTAVTVSGKILPALKRHYKLVAIAILAVAILSQLPRCAGGGGKEDKYLEQFQGSWIMHTLIGSDRAKLVHRPDMISITKTLIHLGDTPLGPIECPMSEAEYEEGALYFPATWYDREPGDGREPGMQDYDLRLTYSKKDDSLTLDVDVSGNWYPLCDYRRG